MSGTMKFRRLYWVTENVAEDGSSEVAGVYTSIPDLIEDGVRWCEGTKKQKAFRVSLVKLDSTKMPLGTWISPDYQGLSSDLEEYVKTQEFTSSECESLLDALKKFPG